MLLSIIKGESQVCQGTPEEFVVQSQEKDSRFQLYADHNGLTIGRVNAKSGISQAKDSAFFLYSTSRTTLNRRFNAMDLGAKENAQIEIGERGISNKRTLSQENDTLLFVNRPAKAANGTFYRYLIPLTEISGGIKELSEHKSFESLLAYKESMIPVEQQVNGRTKVSRNTISLW